MSPLEFHAGFKRHFPGVGNAGRFMDVLMLRIRRTPTLDVLAFDDWLHERHGEYEADGMSMAECIAKHYGEPARAFIESIL